MLTRTLSQPTIYEISKNIESIDLSPQKSGDFYPEQPGPQCPYLAAADYMTRREMKGPAARIGRSSIVRCQITGPAAGYGQIPAKNDDETILEYTVGSLYVSQNRTSLASTYIEEVHYFYAGSERFEPVEVATRGIYIFLNGFNKNVSKEIKFLLQTGKHEKLLELATHTRKLIKQSLELPGLSTTS